MKELELKYGYVTRTKKPSRIYMNDDREPSNQGAQRTSRIY